MTASGRKIKITETLTVGIVHPREISEKDLKHWRDEFKKNKIVQPFSQLYRPVFSPTTDEVKTGSIARANETISSFGRLNVFEKRGWRRSPGPGGIMNDNAWIYRKVFPGGHLLKFQIAPHHDDEYSDTPNRVHLGIAKLENQDVSDVHPVIYSEMIHDIMYMAGKLDTKESTAALEAPK